jgi:hypothetical protein
MRRKLIALSFALVAVAAAQGLTSIPRSEAARACNGILVCCPDGGCRCCSRPCPIQCP